MKVGVLLDFVLTKKEELIWDVKAGDSFGLRDREMVEFMTLCGRSGEINRIRTLDFRRATFGLIKDLLGGIPWVKTIEGREAQGYYSSTTCFKLQISAS